MAETEEQVMMKWEVKMIEEVKGIKAEKIWPFLEDFCNVHKLCPFLADCRRLDGEEGKPGLIRYCVLQPSAAGDTLYAKEKLLRVDPVERSVSYEVIENNIGINSYVGTMKLVESANGEEGCSFEWSVVADPIEGQTFEAFQSLWNSYLHSIVLTIQTLLSPV